MINYDYCPRCGSPLRNITYTCYPPLEGRKCFSCGWEYVGRVETPAPAPAVPWPAERKNMIKDSGDRTQFYNADGKEIGVRDMHTGKGRMDLLPWAALIEVSRHCEEGAQKYGERNCEKGIPIHSLIDSAMRHLARYMEGERDEPHLRAAAWNVLFALWMEIKRPEMQDIPARMEASKDA